MASTPSLATPPTAQLRAATPLDLAELVAVSAIWGSAFLCIAIALEDFAPLEIAAWRLGGAALVLLAVVRWRGIAIPCDARCLALFTAIGCLNGAAPFTLIGWGQQSVPSSTTGILLATAPFWSLALARVLARDEPLGWPKVLGMVLGFAGVVVLFGVRPGSDPGASTLPGMLAIVLAAGCYALSALLIRRLADVPNLAVVAGTLSAAALVLLPFLLVLYPPWHATPGALPLAAVGFLTLGPTALAVVMRTRIVQRNGAVFMSGVGYLIPLFAVFWGWLFLDERPTSRTVLALALVLGGIAIGQWRSGASTGRPTPR